MKRLYFLSLFMLACLFGYAGVITVENTLDAGPGSLRRAVTDANDGDTITFNPSLIAQGNNTIALLSGEISFNKDLTFIGLITSSDTLFVSGSNVSRVFNIAQGTVTKMDRMAIVNGSAGAAGGGINAYILTVSNSVIMGNSVSSISNTVGGGIFAYNLTLEHSLVKNNSVISPDGSIGGGVSAFFLTINHCIITGNTAISTSSLNSASGGGIYATEHLNLHHSTVSGNLVDGALAYGGGLYITATLNMSNSIIEDNAVLSGTSSARGGGMYISLGSSGNNLTIDNSTFVGNDVASTNSTASGGAIYARSNSVSAANFSTLSLTHCTIAENTVSNTSTNADAGAGAGLYADDIYVTIDHSSITGNMVTSTAEAYGGGIYATTDNNPSPAFSGLMLTNSILSGNSISSPDEALGGGMFVISESISPTAFSSRFELTVENSLISGNSASSTSNVARGGGLYSFATATFGTYNSRVRATINHSTIKENSVTSPSGCTGGGMYARSNSGSCTSTFEVNNSTISENVAFSSDGTAVAGGIYTTVGSSSTMDLSLNQSTIYGNTASSTSPLTSAAGGAMLCTGSGSSSSNLSVMNTTISGNSASSNNNANGGGIITAPIVNFIIGSSIVAGNIGDNNISGSITTSNGYNIFEDSLSGTIATDQMNVTSGALNLGPLQNNGGSTFTAAPGPGSVAINMGNPTDSSDAQNGPIIGIRDAGAAENGITACPTVYDSITQVICFGEVYSFGGAVLTSSGTYQDTLPNANGCDSVVTLQLTINPLPTGVETQTACDSYTWTDGNTYTTNNTLATDTVSTANGCDSLVTF